MKKVFFDINVILDVFQKRMSHYTSSAQILSLCETRKIQGFISSASFGILFYLLQKEVKKQKAIEALKDLKMILKIAPLDEKILDNALQSHFSDFEDAIQYYSAISQKVECILTRNKKDFKPSQIQVLTPEEFLAFSNTEQ